MHILYSIIELLTISALASAVAITTTSSRSTSVTITTTAATTSTTVEPCALASSASSAYMSANTDAPSARIPADLAYSCLLTLPNQKDPALELLQSLHPYLEWQTTLAYLKDPPQGYLFPGVDIENGLNAITKNVESGAYASEYEFQIDLYALVAAAKDGHFSFTGDAIGLFQFYRPVDLVSVSSDGFQLPQVFATGDLVTSVDGAYTTLNTTYKSSPITSIDGVDVVTFLEATSFVENSQDPDSCYNAVFSQLSKHSMSAGFTFSQPRIYPGPSTTLSFANGTSRTFTNIAFVNGDLTNVTNGDDLYSKALVPSSTESSATTSSAAGSADSTSEASTTDISSSVPTATSTSSAVPTVPGYPYPVVKHSLNSVSGYFLNNTGFEDVAVLAVPTFEPPEGTASEFQQVVQEFLAETVQEGKTKLVIDLQGNGGGIVDLGLDLFAQLFPSIAPETNGAFRATAAFEAVAQSKSDALSSAIADNSNSSVLTPLKFAPFTYQIELKPDGSAFESWEELFGPVELSGDNFTSLLWNNNSNSEYMLFDEGFALTGTGNRTGFTQPFEPEDIILLYDGVCASTCTIFSELMKNLAGVQSIAVGGRPQNGPMQGVGGVKGSSLFPFTLIYEVLSAISDDSTAQATLQDTIFENMTDYAFTRSASPSNPGGVNSKNNFRLGDESFTPLHFVYEASDCRIWWTKEMLTDITFLWDRIAYTAFAGDSRYCVTNSTGHPTSLSGGLKQGQLGPQQPPAGAKSTVNGWIIPTGNGRSVVGKPGTMSEVVATVVNVPSAQIQAPVKAETSGAGKMFRESMRVAIAAAIATAAATGMVIAL